ncbi:hypothetical protein [Candidatus Nitrospira bockiana]
MRIAALVTMSILLVMGSLSAASLSPRGHLPPPPAEWIWQVEDWLKEAVRESPKGAALQAEAQRLVHDIRWNLEQAAERRRQADQEMAAFHAREAVSLLQRGIRKGLFNERDIQPVLQRLAEYLGGVRV